MNAHIRTTTISDAKAACHVLRRSIAECCEEDHHNDPILLDAWLHNKNPESVRSWLQSPGGFSIVAMVEAAVVGFALSSPSGEIMLCYVLPEVRFTGAGKAMLRAIEANASAADVQSLHLESTCTARAFYLRSSFVPSGPPCVAFGMEAHPMSKQLVANSVFDGGAPFNLNGYARFPQQ